MKIKHLFTIGLVAVLTCALLASCGSDDDTPSNPNNGGTETPSNNDPDDPHSNPTPGNDLQPPQGAVLVAEAVQYVNSLTTASTDVTEIVLKGTCSESEIQELAQSISKSKAPINLDLSNCEPETINFQGCANLKEVTLPDNVQIPDRAFADCPNLEVVTIGDAGTTSKSLSKYSFEEFTEDTWDFVDPTHANLKANVGKEAFADSWFLKRVYVKSINCKVIGEGAFKGCKKLELVELGNVCVIEEDAFNGCEALASVTIPLSVSRLAVSSFGNCPKLTKGKISFASNSDWYWSWSKDLWHEYKAFPIDSDESMALDNGAANPSNHEFQTKPIYTMEYLFHIKTYKNPTAEAVQCSCEGIYNFVYNRNLSDAELSALAAELKKRPDVKVKLYANWSKMPAVFSGLKNLYSVELSYPTMIYPNAFQNCSNLVSVIAPRAVAVGPNAFSGTPDRISFKIGTENSTGQWFKVDNVSAWESMSGGAKLTTTLKWKTNYDYLYWKSGATDEVQVIKTSYNHVAYHILNSCPNDGEYKLVVDGYYVEDSGISEALGKRNDDNIKLHFDFTDVINMTKVTHRFFWRGKNIVYGIVLPDEITEIAQEAFTNCKNIKKFKLPPAVETIGMIAFMGCEFETNIVLPASLKEIGQGAFVKAFTGNARPEFANADASGNMEFGSDVWYAKDANTDEEIEYSSWINTEWWNVQSYSFFTKKSTDIPYDPIVGDGFVDLGLPSGTLWATCNVGAQNPWDYGDYFAWGETRPKDKYDWGTYKYANSDYNEQTKYCNESSCGYNGFTDNLTVLLPEDDAATANLGKDWRMPTLAEFRELYDNCDWEWTSNYNGTGVAGRIVKSRITSNSLFFPAAGYRYGTHLGYAGSAGYYWSLSLYTVNPNCGRDLNFDSGGVDPDDWDGRRYGQSVRPVRCR